MLGSQDCIVSLLPLHLIMLSHSLSFSLSHTHTSSHYFQPRICFLLVLTLIILFTNPVSKMIFNYFPNWPTPTLEFVIYQNDILKSDSRFCPLFERLVTDFMSLHFAVPEDKGKYLINFALSQSFLSPSSTVSFLRWKTLSMCRPELGGQTLSCWQSRWYVLIPSTHTKDRLFCVCFHLTLETELQCLHRDQFQTIVKYVNKCKLQAIILAFILIVNSYDKMIFVPVYHYFCSQGSNIRILPSGSFGLGELIMIPILVKELNKAALGQQ